VKYAWIEGQTHRWPVSAMCEVPGVSLIGLKAWRIGGKRSAARFSDAQLLALIRPTNVQFQGTYGSPRMHDELRQRGYRVGRACVERLLRENGIRAWHKRCGTAMIARLEAQAFPGQAPARSDRRRSVRDILTRR